MVIGIPKEIKDHEYRVGVTPYGVASLHESGHTVLLEADAGLGSGLSDLDFESAGAKICASKRELFEASDLIVKVKEPLQVEFDFFHPGQLLFTFLHLAANPPLLDFLQESCVSAIAYETIEPEKGLRPILKPMSEVAGRMAVLVGAYHLQKAQGGSGQLLSGLAGVPKGRVCVIGGGVVGKNAAQSALALGADVVVIEQSSSRRAFLEDFFRGRVVTLSPYPGEIAEQVRKSHLVIGAASVTGDKAPHLVTRKMVSDMPRGAVAVDVAIDQGGCFETSRATSHSDPTYTLEGVLHYCVTNIPGVLPKTATFALASESLPYLQKLADFGLGNALSSDPGLAGGLNVHQGQISHPSLKEVFAQN